MIVAWWTTERAPGRISPAATQVSLVKFVGTTKSSQGMTAFGLRRRHKSLGSGMTRSGRIFQPSRHCRGAGLSFVSPSGAPASTQVSYGVNVRFRKPRVIQEMSVLWIGMPGRHLPGDHQRLSLLWPTAARFRRSGARTEQPRPAGGRPGSPLHPRQHVLVERGRPSRWRRVRPRMTSIVGQNRRRAFQALDLDHLTALPGAPGTPHQRNRADHRTRIGPGEAQGSATHRLQAAGSSRTERTLNASVCCRTIPLCRSPGGIWRSFLPVLESD